MDLLTHGIRWQFLASWSHLHYAAQRALCSSVTSYRISATHVMHRNASANQNEPRRPWRHVGKKLFSGKFLAIVNFSEMHDYIQWKDLLWKGQRYLVPVLQEFIFVFQSFEKCFLGVVPVATIKKKKNYRQHCFASPVFSSRNTSMTGNSVFLDSFPGLQGSWKVNKSWGG